MSKIDDLFSDLKSRGQVALMPFITAGDPDQEYTFRLIEALDSLGCHLCEVGIPYSDPIADGPVIQASYSRALDAGFQLTPFLQHLPELTRRIRMPLVAMVSYSIIFRKGPEAFVDAACNAGFAGAIVPDCPLESAESLVKICRDRDFSLIQLVTPTTPLERAIRIAGQSSGFLYFVSVTGITGERSAAPEQALEKMQQLRSHTDLPICLGFGISTPQHIQTIGNQVDGFIVGSAIVRRIGESVANSPSVEPVTEFAKSLLKAIQQL